jgi:hypothetical protein
MRICDRCRKEGIRMRLKDLINSTEYDLCHSCSDDFSKFVAPIEEKVESVTPKRGRPSKKEK